jgi:hypothetical protein
MYQREQCYTPIDEIIALEDMVTDQEADQNAELMTEQETCQVADKEMDKKTDKEMNKETNFKITNAHSLYWAPTPLIHGKPESLVKTTKPTMIETLPGTMDELDTTVVSQDSFCETECSSNVLRINATKSNKVQQH